MAKIIEAKAIISGKETLGPLLDQLSNKLDKLGKNKAVGQQVDNVAKSLKNVQAQMAAIDKFQASKAGFRSTADRFQQTKIAVERAAAAMKAGEGPAKKLAADYQRAQVAVSNAAKAFQAQSAAFGSARRAMDAMGIPASKAAAAQDRLRTAVERTNAALTKQERAAARQQRHTTHGGVGNMLVHGAAGYVGAHGMARGVKHAVAEGAHLQHERVALVNAGRTPEEMERIEKASRDVVKSVPTSSFTENLKVINETTGAFGTVEHAIENLPFMQKSASVIHAAAGDKVKDSAGEMGNKFARFFEMRGTAIDSPLFRKEAEQMVRAMAFFRGNFNPSEMLLFGQQATPGTLSNYNERFLTKVAPSLVTEFGGDRAGTAANAFRNVIMGKANDKKQAEEWMKLGLLDPKQAITKAGHAVSWKAGAVKDTNLALADPLKWAETVLIPALKKKGVNVDDKMELTKAVGTMFRNSMANRFIEALVQPNSRHRLHKDEENINKAGDLDTIYQRNISEDPTVAMTALTSSLENLTAAATSPAMKQAAESINWLAGSLQSLAQLGKDNPNAAMATGAGAVIGGGAGALWMTRQFLNGFGLTTSAAALDGAAAALTGAAATLAGGKVANVAAGVATSAVTAGTAAGAGAAAGWGSRLFGAVPFVAHPLVLAGGLAAGGLNAAHLINELDPEGAAQEAKLRQRNAARRRRGMTETFNADRDRMGLPPIGFPTAPAWPAMITGGSAAMSPPVAELKGSAEVKGEASVKVEVTASSSLLQIIEQAKSIPMNLNGHFNANGPGSVGKSSPDSAAPQNIWGGAVGPR